MLTNWYKICSAIYPTHIQPLSFISYCVQTFVSLSLTTYDFSFLSLTFQSKLSCQPRHQPLCSTSGYLIQSTSLFNQAFSSTLDYLSGSIGNLKDSPDHLVSPGHLDLLLCTEPTRSLTILCGSTSKPQSSEAETM